MKEFMDSCSRFLQGSARPLISFILVAGVVGLAFTGRADPNKVVDMTSAVVLFWFAARSATKGG